MGAILVRVRSEGVIQAGNWGKATQANSKGLACWSDSKEADVCAAQK